MSLLHAGLTRGAMPTAAQPSPSFPPLHLHTTGQFKAALPSVARAGLFSCFVHFIFLCGSVSHSSFMILFSPLTDWALSPNSKICFSSPHPPICHQTGSLLLSLSILLLQFSPFLPLRASQAQCVGSGMAGVAHAVPSLALTHRDGGLPRRSYVAWPGPFVSLVLGPSYVELGDLIISKLP